jgi:hypothetical protein
VLNEYEIKFKKFDKKKTLDAQINELTNDLKNVGIKIVENAKFSNGYGEAICLVLTQLLDKYLINQNFIFKKPKFDTKIQTEEILDDIKLETNRNIRTFSGKKFNATMTGIICLL